MSIYLTNQSNSVLDLIKYGNNIRNMAKQFGFQAAKSYDESFRTVRKFMNFELGTINDELWRSAAHSNFSQSAIGSKKKFIESIKCRVCPFTEGPSSNSRLASAGLSV
jgi:hypothetical protein